MKLPHPNKGNLSQPDAQTLAMMQRIAQDLVHEDTGVLVWSNEEGFTLKLPNLEDESRLPIPLYLLSLCFMRLTTDDGFGQELVNWAKRNQN